MPLQDFQEQCLALTLELAGHPNLGTAIAGPFVSVPPLNGRIHPRIMYVGKATHGDFWLAEFLADPALATRRAQMAAFLDGEAGHHPGAFWTFARMLAQIGPQVPAHPVGNIIWSNLMRIGSQAGNPNADLGHAQWDLLVGTIQDEVETYEPDVVVFVTSHYWNEVVTTAFPRWEHGVPGLDFAIGNYRPALDGAPPMFWFGHPQGVARATLVNWRDRVTEAL